MAYVYNWDFGDGETSTEVTPSHVYNYPGRYTVTLTVYDDSDNIKNSIVKIMYIYVYNEEIIPRRTNKCFYFGVNNAIAQTTEG